jgi:hypothetical protein
MMGLPGVAGKRIRRAHLVLIRTIDPYIGLSECVPRCEVIAGKDRQPFEPMARSMGPLLAIQVFSEKLACLCIF